MKLCPLCGNYFEPKSSNNKYCSVSHQRAAWYKRKKAGLIVTNVEKEVIMEKYKESRRWAVIGKNSSVDAMMEVHRLFNPDNITYNA